MQFHVTCKPVYNQTWTFDNSKQTQNLKRLQQRYTLAIFLKSARQNIARVKDSTTVRRPLGIRRAYFCQQQTDIQFQTLATNRTITSMHNPAVQQLFKPARQNIARFKDSTTVRRPLGIRRAYFCSSKQLRR